MRCFPNSPKPAAAATVPFDESRWFTKLQLPGVDRVSQLAVAAASLAMRDAGALDAASDRIGVYAGCGMGGAAALEAAYASAHRGGRVPPLTVPAFMPNAPAAHVAMRHGVQGPVLTYSVACASSAVALAEAARAVRHGDVDVAIAGGAEALIVPGVVSAWQALQTLASFQGGEAAQRVQAVRGQPQRLRARRRRGIRGAGVRRSRAAARRARACRAGRQRHHLRRHPLDQARQRRPTAHLARARCRMPA